MPSKGGVIVGGLLGLGGLMAIVALTRGKAGTYTFYCINPPPDATLWSVAVVYGSKANPILPMRPIASAYVLNWKTWMETVGYPDPKAEIVNVNAVVFNFDGDSNANWRTTGAIPLNVVTPKDAPEDEGTTATLDWANNMLHYNEKRKWVPGQIGMQASLFS